MFWIIHDIDEYEGKYYSEKYSKIVSIISSCNVNDYLVYFCFSYLCQKLLFLYASRTHISCKKQQPITLRCNRWAFSAHFEFKYVLRTNYLIHNSVIHRLFPTFCPNPACKNWRTQNENFRGCQPLFNDTLRMQSLGFFGPFVFFSEVKCNFTN